MKETWDTMAKEDVSQRGNKIRRIQSLDNELSALEVVMKKTTNDILYKKLEQQRADKNIEKEILQDEIDNNMYNEDEFRSLYEKTKGVIENPLSFRDI